MVSRILKGSTFDKGEVVDDSDPSLEFSKSDEVIGLLSLSLSLVTSGTLTLPLLVVPVLTVGGCCKEVVGVLGDIPDDALLAVDVAVVEGFDKEEEEEGGLFFRFFLCVTGFGMDATLLLPFPTEEASAPDNGLNEETVDDVGVDLVSPPLRTKRAMA